MIVLLLPLVSSRVPGVPVASPCLWGKPQNLSFLKVSKEVVMSFCVAGVALCDIPTCLIMCQKCQNCRKSRTKCWFFCIHRRVYGGSCKPCPFVMLPTVKIAGSLVRNDRFGAPTCLVSSPWCSCGFAVSMGEAAKPLLFRRFPRKLSCRFAWQAWHFVTFQPV